MSVCCHTLPDIFDVPVKGCMFKIIFKGLKLA